jgi:heme/copper-type cytochrome/quinol oxidase subunit 3
MQKYYLLSLLVLSVVIPLRLVSQAGVEVAAKKMYWHFLLFLWLWGQGIKYIYWRLPQ